MSHDKILYLTMVIEPNDDGYLTRCPDIQGAFAEGDTVEESVFNCIDVVKLIASYRSERGESLGRNEIEIMPEMRFSFAMPVGVN